MKWLAGLAQNERRVVLMAGALVVVWIPFAMVREAEYTDAQKVEVQTLARVSADSAVACSDSAIAAQLAAPPVLLPDSTSHVCVYYRTRYLSTP